MIDIKIVPVTIFSILQLFTYAIPIILKTWLKDYIFVLKSYKLLKEENTRLKDNIQKFEFDTNLEREKAFYLSNSDEFFKQSIIEAEKNVYLNYQNSCSLLHLMLMKIRYR